MKKEDLLILKEKISNLSDAEKKLRDIYLKNIANGKLQGPIVGYSSIDKTWLKYYTDNTIMSDLPKKTAYQYIFDKNKKNLDKTSLNYFGRKITYEEFFKNVDELSDILLNYGIKEGDIVSIAMPSFPETIYLFYALSNIGAVSNMIDPRTNSEMIYQYVNEVHSKLFVTVDIAANKLNEIKEQTTVNDVLVVSASNSLPQPLKLLYNLKNKSEFDKNTFTKWEEFIKNYSGENDFKKIDYVEDRPVVLVHTGGTTGKSKAVILTNENINAASFQCETAGYDFQSWHNWLNIMPPFIAYGVGNGLHLPLACGMEVVLIPAFKPEEFDKLLMKYKPNHMVGVPSHYENLMKSKKLSKKDLSYIIAPTVGGDKMNEELEEEVNTYLKDHNCDYKIVKGYGLTEVNAAVAACTSNENNKLGSVGIPFPKTNISIFEPQTENELRYGEVGEICISGPNTMKGYYHNEEETNNMIRIHSDGSKWVHSGDLGYMDRDGNLFIIDRIKRIIVRSDGFKVFPSMIEDVINGIENVKTSKVVGIRDLNYSHGKLPKAHVVLENENVDIEEQKNIIYNECMKKLPEYCQLQEIQFDKDLPLTPIGKVDFKKLEEQDLKKQEESIKVLRK